MQGLPSDFEQFFLVKNNLLTSVHNDTDDYNRVTGIAQLKAFSCAKTYVEPHQTEHLQPTMADWTHSVQ